MALAFLPSARSATTFTVNAPILIPTESIATRVSQRIEKEAARMNQDSPWPGSLTAPVRGGAGGTCVAGHQPACRQSLSAFTIDFTRFAVYFYFRGLDISFPGRFARRWTSSRDSAGRAPESVCRG